MPTTLQITASEENIKDIFNSNLYIIPVYQRPYSWDIARCEKLLADLNDQIVVNSSTYFLGTIITTSEIDYSDDKLSKNDKKCCSVIDGQQRLTTLLLLMRALYKRDGRNEDLKECLYSRDSRDKEKLISTRLISYVNNNSEADYFMSLFDETEYSKEIIKNGSFKDKHYQENYAWFDKEIGKLKEKDVQKLADFVLGTVTLLKVTVPKRDDALTIFKTINDRGMQLDESDILKADIYSIANKDNQGVHFIKAWDSLYKRISMLGESIKDFDMPFLFRYYMHIKRGINEETSKEISLLDFFQGKSIDKTKSIEKNNLANITWTKTIEDLDKLCGVLEWLIEKKNGNIGYLYNVLRCYNNLYPHYAIVTYLFHRMSKNDGIWYLSHEERKDFIDFFEKIMAFSYTIVFLKPGVNAIKEMIYKIIVGVSNPNSKFDLSSYNKYSKDEFETLEIHLKNEMPLKIARGYLTLLVYLNKKTDMKKMDIPNVKTLNIEHILPKNWDNNYYDSWSKEKVEEVMNKLGNLVLMDRATNIGASNLWFSKKKEKYIKSSFLHGEIQDLLDIDSEIWNYDQFLEREKYTIQTLVHFFRDKQK